MCFGKKIKIRIKKVESGDKGDGNKDGNKGTPQPIRRSGAQATKSLASLAETTKEKVSLYFRWLKNSIFLIDETVSILRCPRLSGFYGNKGSADQS